MVQVDIVWSYAFGASFAAASVRTLRKSEKLFEHRAYQLLIHYLAILFAPSGLILLSRHPSWETMQVVDSISEIPFWLMGAFAVTNVTQGMVGYYVGYRLAKKGDYYGAHVNWLVAWILFWFILVCGWDTTGYQRFLYDRDMMGQVAWTPGTHMGIEFFTSSVFQTLAAMGVFFGPVLWRGIVVYNYLDVRHDMTIPRPEKTNIHKMAAVAFGLMFGGTLGIAIVCGQIVTKIAQATSSVLMGYAVGVPLALIAGYFLLFRRGGLMYKLTKILFIKEP